MLASVNGTGTGRSYAELAFTDAEPASRTRSRICGRRRCGNFWASWLHTPDAAEMQALHNWRRRKQHDAPHVYSKYLAEAEPDRQGVLYGRSGRIAACIDPNLRARIG